jgi:hypothetical protein
MFFFSFMNGMLIMYPGEWREIAPGSIRAAVYRLLGVKGEQT